MPKHTYASAERFILSREFFGMKLGLENIREFLTDIGSPQYNYKTIHIAGTNGKGSTSAMLASILMRQGYKTGLFTSPHLVTLRERVRVNGRNIPRTAVTAFIDRHRTELSRRKLSFFELITAMAFDYFNRVNVDIAVIETGLGGRLDASNVLRPILTVTTDISKDHTEILGATLTKIAREKAGIVKPGVPHLLGLLPESAERVLRATCDKQGAPVYQLTVSDYVPHPETMSLDFRHNGVAVPNLTPALIGTHQIKNTALVLKAASILREHGLRISKKAIVSGIESTVWPGRFQIKHFRSKPTHIFDVSHNAAGMAAFVESFHRVFPGKKAWVVTGFVKRKEHQKMFDSLSHITRAYFLVPLDTKRSTDTRELVQSINWKGVQFHRFGSLNTAYTKVLKTAAPDDIIVIIGSHYLVGEFFETYHIR